jgi:hypothetical protein
MNRRAQSDLPTVRADAPAGLFLARDGTWFHDGQAVDHERLAALLHRSIARDASGELVVTTGRDVLPFAVEDAPFLVRSISTEVDGLVLTLSDGSVEPLTGSSLCMDGAGRVHVRVKHGRFWALFSRTAAQALVSRIDHEGAHVDAVSRKIPLVVGDRSSWLD